MDYVSTRAGDAAARRSASYVIKEGIAPDGGLYVPESIPALDGAALASLSDITYRERAAKILGMYLTDYSAEELSACAAAAYSEQNFGPRPAPLSLFGQDAFLELWHGPTCAFKDMALQIMPRLLSLALGKQNCAEDALILVATSGDTGKAALEGYRDVDRVRILVFYPTGGVSKIQRRQMASQQGGNVGVAAIRGNFDDAQTAVKRVFTSAEMARRASECGCFFSSANSINWGRLAPQIVYYVSAYCDLAASGKIARGEKINICVPTGNFGNILAAFIAKRMGLPVDRLICASNSNNVLTDFFATGVYDRRREFHTTISPSMDILISSNLERLLYFFAGAENTAAWMRSLSATGAFDVGGALRDELAGTFSAYYLTEDETMATIARRFERDGYLIDPHTAVAVGALEKYRAATGDDRVTVIASTASPYKFAPAVCEALSRKVSGDEFDCIDALAAVSGLPVPPQLLSLRTAADRFTEVIDRDGIDRAVTDFMKSR